MSRSTQMLLSGAFLSVVTVALADDVAATPQGGTESVSAEPLTAAELRILEHLDRNGDGILDSGEAARLPVPMRKWMRENGLQQAWPTPVAEFGPTLVELLADLRAGRHSTSASGVRRGGSTAARATRPKPAPKTFPPVEIKGYEGLVAERTFTRLDKEPTDGKITRRELDDATRQMFEGGGVDIPDEMDRDTFLQHHVRIQLSE